MTAIERTALNSRNLVRLGAVTGVIGGALRVASSIVPYAPGQLWLETLYGVIDLCLMFGLISIYLAFAEELAIAGLALFAIALAGLSSIVGPDATEFGIDFYSLGALVLLLGLAGMSVQLLRRRSLVISSLLWVAALVFSIVGAVSAMQLAITIGGVLFGAGFLLAGLAILGQRSRRAAA